MQSMCEKHLNIENLDPGRSRDNYVQHILSIIQYKSFDYVQEASFSISEYSGTEQTHEQTRLAPIGGLTGCH